MTREEAIRWLNCVKEEVDESEGTMIYISKEKADVLAMAIEALQGDMYCPNCGVRLVPEDEYLEPTPTHGRLIDADALEKELSKRWDISDDQDFCNKEVWDALRNAPTVQADRPHGEWIETSEGTMCCNCHKFPYDDGEYHIANWYSGFCPNCGADMRGGK